jgi:hypothetical protein
MAMAKYDESFQSNDLQFPNRDIPEENKQCDYHRNWAKGIYSKYYNDRTGIPRSFQNDIDRTRS